MAAASRKWVGTPSRVRRGNATWAGDFDSVPPRDPPPPVSMAQRKREGRSHIPQTRDEGDGKKAIQIGCGAWDRGSVVPMLHHDGYEIVFLHPNQQGVDLINSTPSYDVTWVDNVGTGSRRSTTIDNYRALNLATQEKEIIRQIATADVVTCIVDLDLLPVVADLIACGVVDRNSKLTPEPLTVVFYHNDFEPISDLTNEIIRRLAFPHNAHGSEKRYLRNMLLYNTIVDRRVLKSPNPNTLDVQVEEYCTWHFTRCSYNPDRDPPISLASCGDMNIYLGQRKRLTFDVAQLMTAYWAHHLRFRYLHEAIKIQQVEQSVRGALDEIARCRKSSMLTWERAHPCWSRPEVQSCVDSAIARIGDPSLDYTSQDVEQSWDSLVHLKLLTPLASRLDLVNHDAPCLVKAVEMAFRYQDVDGNQSSQALGQFMRQDTPQVILSRLPTVRCERSHQYGSLLRGVIKKVQGVMAEGRLSRGPNAPIHRDEFEMLRTVSEAYLRDQARKDAAAGRGDAAAGRGDAAAGRGDAAAGRGDAAAGRGDAAAGRGDAAAGRGAAAGRADPGAGRGAVTGRADAGAGRGRALQAGRGGNTGSRGRQGPAGPRGGRDRRGGWGQGGRNGE